MADETRTIQDVLTKVKNRDVTALDLISCMTEDGAFAHQYLLAPGYNRIILDAEDKYGAQTQQIIEVMYVPTNGTTPAATTTPASRATSSPEATVRQTQTPPGEAAPETLE